MARSTRLLVQLGLATLLTLAAAIAIGWTMTGRYDRLVFAFQEQQAQKVADVAVADLLWSAHSGAVTRLAEGIAQEPELAEGLRQRDHAAMMRVLEEIHHRGLVTSGEVVLRSVAVLDENGAVVIAHPAAEPMLPLALDTDLSSRRDLARLRVLRRVWLDNGVPHMVVVVPVGGLRVAGYLALTVNPLAALSRLDQLLGMAVTVRSLIGGRELARPGSFAIPAGAITHQAGLVLKDPQGVPLARLDVTLDVTALESELERTRAGALGLFVVVAGGLGLASWLAVRLHNRSLEFFIGEIERREGDLRAAKERAETALADTRRAQAQLVEAEKMAALGSLVAGVAHEINTPVGTALTAASVLDERTQAFAAQVEAGKIKRAEAAEYTRMALDTTRLMLSNLDRAGRLIQAFKLVAADQTHDERRHFALGAYLDDIIGSLRPRLKRTAVEVVIGCAEDVVVDTYPGALSQVVSNFIINALVHAFEDGQSGRIRVTAEALPGGDVELRCADDGRGIPRDTLGHIFEPFFTTKRGRGGTGLGLHIVFNIVRKKLGGFVWAESTPGQGTTFVVRFPATAPEERHRDGQGGREEWRETMTTTC